MLLFNYALEKGKKTFGAFKWVTTTFVYIIHTIKTAFCVFTVQAENNNILHFLSMLILEYSPRFFLKENSR